MILRLLSTVNSARVFSRASSRSVSYGEGYDAANQLLATKGPGGPTTYSYDGTGNRGRIDTTAASTFYAWDARNRLAAVEPVAGPVTFTYDADSRRLGKQTLALTKRYIYDFEKVLQETDGFGVTQNQYTSTEEQYGDLVSAYGGGQGVYYAFDAVGSADALLDDTGSTTDRYAYRAFGLVAHTQGTSPNDHTLVGRQNYAWDLETSLYFLGAGGRQYDPEAARFPAPDPAFADANRYRYAGNDPVNKIDPSGMYLIAESEKAKDVWLAKLKTDYGVVATPVKLPTGRWYLEVESSQSDSVQNINWPELRDGLRVADRTLIAYEGGGILWADQTWFDGVSGGEMDVIKGLGKVQKEMRPNNLVGVFRPDPDRVTAEWKDYKRGWEAGKTERNRLLGKGTWAYGTPTDAELKRGDVTKWYDAGKLDSRIEDQFASELTSLINPRSGLEIDLRAKAESNAQVKQPSMFQGRKDFASYKEGFLDGVRGYWLDVKGHEKDRPTTLRDRANAIEEKKKQEEAIKAQIVLIILSSGGGVKVTAVEEASAGQPGLTSQNAPGSRLRIAESGEAVNIGRGDAIQHFTDLKGASGITGVSEEALAGLKPGQKVVIDSAHFKPGANPFLTGEGGGVAVTKLGTDATAGQLERVGVFGDKQQFVVEFSRETLLTNKIPLEAVRPERSIFSIAGDTTVKGTITVQKVR
jgi:RHS repeat-associated protein